MRGRWCAPARARRRHAPLRATRSCQISYETVRKGCLQVALCALFRARPRKEHACHACHACERRQWQHGLYRQQGKQGQQAPVSNKLGVPFSLLCRSRGLSLLIVVPFQPLAAQQRPVVHRTAGTLRPSNTTSLLTLLWTLFQPCCSKIRRLFTPHVGGRCFYICTAGRNVSARAVQEGCGSGGWLQAW